MAGLATPRASQFTFPLFVFLSNLVDTRSKRLSTDYAEYLYKARPGSCLCLCLCLRVYGPCLMRMKAVSFALQLVAAVASGADPPSKWVESSCPDVAPNLSVGARPGWAGVQRSQMFTHATFLSASHRS